MRVGSTNILALLGFDKGTGCYFRDKIAPVDSPLAGNPRPLTYNTYRSANVYVEFFTRALAPFRGKSKRPFLRSFVRYRDRRTESTNSYLTLCAPLQPRTSKFIHDRQIFIGQRARVHSALILVGTDHLEHVRNRCCGRTAPWVLEQVTWERRHYVAILRLVHATVIFGYFFFLFFFSKTEHEFSRRAPVRSQCHFTLDLTRVVFMSSDVTTRHVPASEIAKYFTWSNYEE